MNINFTAIAPMVLNFILRNVFLERRMRNGMSESLSFINAMSAVSMAVTVPLIPMPQEVLRLILTVGILLQLLHPMYQD